MIIAVPDQVTVQASGIGVPEHTSVLTYYRWRCTTCHVSSKPANRWSHAASALDRGGYHERVEQCQRLGQLELFALAGGAR